MTVGPREHTGETRATRATRDPLMDALRVLSLGVVVAFHWLGLLPQLHAGVYTDTPITMLVPSLWPLTWLIDVLPLFLFVGGFVNARSYDAARAKGETDWQFIEHRYRRLLVPTLVFIAACSALLLVVSWLGGLFGSPLRLLSVRNTAPFGQLWFVAAYMLQIALVPLTLRAHRRYGLKALGAIVVAVALVDLAWWGLGSTAPLLLNAALVWMLPHQLGYFYADDRLGRYGARTWAAIALLSLASLAIVTSLPVYSRDLLDPSQKVLTFQAFTFPLVLQAMWIIAAAMLLAPLLGRLLRGTSRVRRGVERANRSIMTVFLWHTAALLLAVLALSGVPGVLSSTPTATWWQARPLVVLGAALVVALIVAGTAALRRVQARQRDEVRDMELSPPDGRGTSSTGERTVSSGPGPAHPPPP